MTATCKGCGRSIRWATSPTGAALPLEEVFAYRLLPNVDQSPEGRGRPLGPPRVERTAPVLISHFLTCKDRDRFSGAGRAK